MDSTDHEENKVEVNVVEDDKKTKRSLQLAEARKRKQELKQKREQEISQMKLQLDSLIAEKKSSVVQKQTEDTDMEDTDKPVKITKSDTVVVQKESEQDFYVDLKNQVVKTAFTSCLALGSWYLSQKYAPVKKNIDRKEKRNVMSSPFSRPPQQSYMKKKKNSTGKVGAVASE